MHTIIYPVNALRIGGAEQQLLELVRGLDKRTFRPIVAPLYAGGPLEPEFLAVPGVEVVNLNRRNKYDPSPLARMARLLRSSRAAVVQPFLTPATFFGLLPALLVGTPVKVVTERSGVQRFWGRGHKTYLAVEDVLTRAADAVVANSLSGRRMLLERGIPAHKIHVFYNGINPQRLEVDPARTAEFRARLGAPAPPAGNGKIVGILASLTPAKDHATFLRAAAMISARHPETRFAIIGDGPLRAKLEALVTALGLEQRVAFLGFQRRVADLLAGFDVLVSSSHDNEGCSNSILEAMFLGVPVVATRVGGNAELVEHGGTGYLCPMQDPAALAEAVDRCLDQPALTEAITARARQRAAERFTLQRMVNDYQALYLTLLNAKLSGQRKRPAWAQS